MRRWLRFVTLFTLVGLIGLLVWYVWGSRTDAIHLSIATGINSAAIVIDFNRSGCPDDDVVRTADTVHVTNILSPGSCDSRVAMFVQNAAMHFDDPVNVWTDSSGDQLNIPVAPMPQIPITIWVPDSAINGDAAANLDTAKAIYNDMQCGIGFENVAPILTVPALNLVSAGCSNLSPATDVGKILGRMNVYYVDSITDFSGARGIHCKIDQDDDVILINKNIAPPATLAHEIGHALTLDHTNTVDGLNTYQEIPPGSGEFVCNLMLFAGDNQKLLSTGQCFRCNLNDDSAINSPGGRTGLMPGCHLTQKTPACPALAFDVQPK